MGESDAERLKKWRAAARLTQREGAELIGVTEKTLSSWERGARVRPGVMRDAERVYAAAAGEKRPEETSGTQSGVREELEAIGRRASIQAAVADSEKLAVEINEARARGTPERELAPKVQRLKSIIHATLELSAPDPVALSVAINNFLELLIGGERSAKVAPPVQQGTKVG